MKVTPLALLLSALVSSAGCTSTSTPAPGPVTTGGGDTTPTTSDPAPTTPAPTSTAPPPKPPGTANPPVIDPEDRGVDCMLGATDFWAQPAKTLITELPSAMCNFTGNVVLVVNLASYCGYTYQYAPLQTLYEKYKASGFFVLGFPSKSFNQEKDTGAEISAFCTTEYHITFPLFAIADVAGSKRQPVYEWIASQPGYTADVSWNFEKFLVSRKGKVVGRYLSAVEPNAPELESAITAELAKPK